MPEATIVAVAGADERPPAPVGDHPDRHPGGSQQRLHPVDRAGRPAVVDGSRSESDRVDDQHQRADDVAMDERTGRAAR